MPREIAVRKSVPVVQIVENLVVFLKALLMLPHFSGNEKIQVFSVYGNDSGRIFGLFHSAFDLERIDSGFDELRQK